MSRSLTYPKLGRNTVNRLNKRATYDLESIHAIINEALVVHISFSPGPEDPFPTILPMIGVMGSFEHPSAGPDEPLDCYLHGHVSSRVMSLAHAPGGGSGGDSQALPICVAATLVDGIVLSLTPFSHSYNYRSAVLHGYASVVTSDEEKLWATELITNSVVRDRYRAGNSRVPPKKAEMDSTRILRIRVVDGSGKVRVGEPHDDKSDLEDETMVNSVWTGVLPVRETFGPPQPSSYNRVDGLPEHIHLTPGITAVEYAGRRAELAAKLPLNSVAIVSASAVKYRSGAVFYPFHQNPYFFYLTGEHYGAQSRSNLQLSSGQVSMNPMPLQLSLRRPGKAGDINELEALLPDILAAAREVHLGWPPMDERPSSIGTRLRPILQRVDLKIRPLERIVDELRVFKSAAEIANMRTAGKASGRAITKAMGQRFGTEKSLAAFLEYQFKELGCDGPAYVPVVAGGQNALGIHYVRNDDRLHDGDLVLVDAGGEYGGYASDITRCWPVNGKFSAAHKDLYEAVLTVQRHCISLCRQNAQISLRQLHEAAEEGLRDQLTQLGFDLSGNVRWKLLSICILRLEDHQALMGSQALAKLFPHQVGHYIGLDLHDTPAYPTRRVLNAGNCIAVEPGVYVPDDDRWPRHFRRMRIQIEDTVCVQEEAPLVLTTEAVKEVGHVI
ncbi:MAG: hypothetical protein M1826_006230 [Phylliscum demangeonii]|nr:MAG: hypothetical protein M1826_006230 [Phylliscum demangeonii]